MMLLASLFPGLFDGVDRNNQSDIGQIFKVAGNAVRIVMTLAGIAAVIVIIIAGIMYITSGGNPDNTARAKRTITNAVIGLVLVMFAYSIVTLVVTRL